MSRQCSSAIMPVSMPGRSTPTPLGQRARGFADGDEVHRLRQQGWRSASPQRYLPVQRARIIAESSSPPRLGAWRGGWLWHKPERLPRQPVGIAVAMARHPQQLHFIKARQRALGVGNRGSRRATRVCSRPTTWPMATLLSPRSSSRRAPAKLAEAVRHARRAARPRCCNH